MKIDIRLRFEETAINESTGEITHYFIGDKTLLNELSHGRYPEADGMTLSVCLPGRDSTADEALVEFSPFLDEEGCVTDYDWNGLYLPTEEVRELIKMAD